MSDRPEEMTGSRVVVLGAGPAGAAAGLTLARAGLSPVIYDRPRAGGMRRIGESLAPAAWPVLERLGISGLTNARIHLPSPGTVSAWGHEGLTAHNFLFHPHGHGWHLDRDRFEDDLRAFAQASGCRMQEATVRGLDRLDDGTWRVRSDLEGVGETADFVIDASGRSCLTARVTGAGRDVRDDLIAWYAFLRPEGEPVVDARALIEARPEGWWYVALVPGGDIVAAFFADPATVSGDARNRSAWLNMLEASHHARWTTLGHGCRIVEGPRATAAGCVLSAPLAGPGWVACGDAAAAYDPISSHGIATALASGADAAEAVIAGMSGDSRPMANYVGKVLRSFEFCMDQRRSVYAAETRWPDAPFWVRRQGRA